MTFSIQPRPANQQVSATHESEQQPGPGTLPQENGFDRPRPARPGRQNAPRNRLAGAEFTAPTPRENLEFKLKNWENSAPCTTEQTQRQEASKKIIGAFLNRSITLSLAGMKLTSLPDCLHQITSLRQLQLDNNNLREFPALPESLLVIWAKNNDFPLPVAVDPEEVTLLNKQKTMGFIFPIDSIFN